MTNDELLAYLSQRLGADDIKRLSQTADKETLYALMFDADKRLSENAAWILTHLPKAANPWIATKRDELIREAMQTQSTTKCRLCLNLLERLDYAQDDIRTDFLDFCLERAVSPAYQPGIQSLCMKIAYKMCRHYPELSEELKSLLESVEPEYFSAGTRYAWKTVLKLLKK